MELIPAEKLSPEQILQGLEHYRPRRKGWSWRERGSEQLGPFEYRQASPPLENSIAPPAAKNFGGIDPQPECVITSEIASGRFEDDLRRMRMAAWHGADHIMVIRTAGQSHFDGLIEGTPEGVGGVPISRKQLRATRKALDLIEDEVGRPINFHSYISGVAGPEMAVLFAEEGVNGAHQDPQYNVLYRNVNMHRSYVDAAVAKKLMTAAGILQIDGAHNANATAREAWKVTPELMVQHAINTRYSEMVGMPRKNIALSTVPPTAPPAPAVRMDLPYAVALRQLFRDCRFRAQMNTRYIENCAREATVTHTLNLLLTRLTGADIQSTITPDEGRNVPWHYNSIHAINTAKQALTGLDGLNDLVKLDMEGELGRQARELKERAVLFLEEILKAGGYFAAVEQGFFVDSGFYPERQGDGIRRDPAGGVGAGSIVPRDEEYFAPVCHHFGYNRIPADFPPLSDDDLGTLKSPSPLRGEGRGGGEAGANSQLDHNICRIIGGCTLCRPEKIRYIDELDPEDNADKRLAESRPYREDLLKPEVEWAGDGIVALTLFLPAAPLIAEYTALEAARQLGLEEPEVINLQVMHPAEGTMVEIKGTMPFAVDPRTVRIPPKEPLLTEEEIRLAVQERPLKIVAATVGEDEHSVGMREIIDIKHGGLEGYGVECHYLGTSVIVEKVVDAAVELDADAVLISTIITHNDAHLQSMRKLEQICCEKGVRQKLILIAGGTRVTNEAAQAEGLDRGYGRGTKGIQVASFLVERRRERERTLLH